MCGSVFALCVMLVVPLFSFFVCESAPSFCSTFDPIWELLKGLLALSAESNVSPSIFHLRSSHPSPNFFWAPYPLHYSTLLSSNVYIPPALPHCLPIICPILVNNSTVAAMDYSTPCRFVCECALCVCVIMYAQCNLWHSLILHSLLQTGKGINMHIRGWSDDWFKPVQCMTWISNRA